MPAKAANAELGEEVHRDGDQPRGAGRRHRQALQLVSGHRRQARRSAARRGEWEEAVHRHHAARTSPARASRSRSRRYFNDILEILREEGRELRRAMPGSRGVRPTCSMQSPAAPRAAARLAGARSRAGAVRLPARLLAGQRVRRRRTAASRSPISPRRFELYAGDIVYTMRHRRSVDRADRPARDRDRRLSDARREPARVAVLRWLYRWPLFIPFIVAAQCMRTFLAKNGLMNNTPVALGCSSRGRRPSLLDWRGVVITFVWKQTPFVALLLAGAMASLDRSHHRGGAQPRRVAAAHPDRDRAAAGRADAAGRPGPLLRHHAVACCRCR